METFGDENYVGIKEMTMDMKVMKSLVNKINKINLTINQNQNYQKMDSKTLELLHSSILFSFVTILILLLSMNSKNSGNATISKPIDN